jgi:hypothetical protein
MSLRDRRGRVVTRSQSLKQSRLSPAAEKLRAIPTIRSTVTTRRSLKIKGIGGESKITCRHGVDNRPLSEG